MIQVKNLNYAYPKYEQKILHGLNFEVKRGEILGFLGPSGAGKSTTQNILIGKLRNYTGSVQVFSQEMKTVTSDYYERIGVAFEFPNFYSRFTALENLRHFQSLYRNQENDPIALLEQVNLKEYAHVKFEHFSKGMKMRLNYCRAILGNPEILFLDEPTSGLDPVNADRLKQLILERKQSGTTILLTTHQMQTAEQLCDRVAFIVGGEINLIDSPKNLMLQYGQRQLKVEFEVDGQRYTEEFPLEGIGENERYLHVIRSHPIITMHSMEATLDQIFMKVTGASL
ncbi:ABC transporter ATP-binding protein [Bacillus horti]|uniref:Fluoroquinolone transport system ATP-binding protein n=1 Tax=Caldalkalibacillus horti TaxID=77523 RepID=A0ABT9VW02_9BACI|nr:ABC transporter ATP-binding protein [Bacillus horti]MDQ0165065.1 fluoroquinolone transport system ATP-binding protein [Bacillus horti]